MKNLIVILFASYISIIGGSILTSWEYSQVVSTVFNFRHISVTTHFICYSKSQSSLEQP